MGEVGGSRGSLDPGPAEYKAGRDGASDPDAPDYAMIPPPPGPESQLEPASLKLARATLVQSMVSWWRPGCGCDNAAQRCGWSSI